MNVPPTIRLCFVPTAAEINELNELLNVDAHGGSKWKALGCLALPVLVGFLGLAAQVGLQNIGYLLAAIAVVTVVITFLQTRAKKKGEEVVVEITAQGIRLGAGSNRTVLKSATITKLIESDSMLVVRASELGLMLPKRAFDRENELVLTRRLIEAWADAEPDSEDDAMDDDQQVHPTASVSYQLKFSDYVSKLFVSWVPRLVCIVVASLIAGTAVAALADPPEDAKFSDLEMVFFFVIPFMILMCLVVLSVFLVNEYLQARSNLTETHISLSRKGLRCWDAKHDSTIDWTTPTRFKESSKLICIWWPGRPGWLMIPKRAFDSDAKTRAFSTELGTYAHESTWFWA